MNVTTKELRIQPGRIIDQVVHGEEIIVTFRGKPLAKIVPLDAGDGESSAQDETIFGMWSAHDQAADVDDVMRELRQGRQF